MTRGRSWACLLILIPFAATTMAADSESTRRERVESGLRPAIALNQPGQETFRLEDRMRFYKVPGVSIAVIDNGAIAWARGYGVREAGSKEPVTPDTIFQAASISKPVATLVVLRLAEQRALDLNEDVNLRLRTWKLPENEFTRQQKVTLRRLLSHRSGLIDRAGFRGAATNGALPTLRDILETGGWTPAPIRVGFEPGSRFQYSGGGYCLMEQWAEDVSGQAFPVLAKELVLEPLQMTNSSFEQTMSAERAAAAAAGHGLNGKRMRQKWNAYPATSAAGLWTTPSDLARFVMELQGASEGRSRGILSPQMMQDMLTTQGPENDRDSRTIALTEGFSEQPPPSWGLGVGLIGRPPVRFFHTGVNPGYQCEVQAFLQGGRGAVVMTNGDQGWRLVREILWAIAREYEWPGYDYRPEVKRIVPLSIDDLERFVGRYRLSFAQPTKWILEVTRDGNDLWAEISGLTVKGPLHAASSDQCFTVEDAMNLQFSMSESGRFVEVSSDQGWRAHRESAE